MNAARKKTVIKAMLTLLLASIVLGVITAYFFFGSNTGDLQTGEYLYIKTGSNYQDVKNNLLSNGFIQNEWSFDILAKRAGYPAKVKAGKYHIAKGTSNYEIVRMLRSGKQTPVKLTIKKLRTKQDFINLVSSKLEADSTQLKSVLTNDSILAIYQLDSNNAMCAIIPDTYEFWWNTNAEKTYQKIASYYQRFWTNERLKQAQQKGLTAAQTVILASIIEEETNYNPEKDTIASVYLNRLHKGMMLQADPTARFAYGDFTIKRITSKQTNYPSLYNTYFVTGLPPGPICTPSKKSIEAVLNAANTNYLFFCAKEDLSGSHRFAKDYATHQQNAKKFQQALNERGIK